MGHSAADWDLCDELNVTDIQMRAIELTVQGLGDVQIAQILSITRKTLWRWKTFDENYRQVLTEARSQAHAFATDRYQALLLRATGVLAKFLEDTQEDNRFRAATVLLNMAGCFRPLTRKFVLSTTRNNDISDSWPEPELPPKMG